MSFHRKKEKKEYELQDHITARRHSTNFPHPSSSSSSTLGNDGNCKNYLTCCDDNAADLVSLTPSSEATATGLMPSIEAEEDATAAEMTSVLVGASATEVTGNVPSYPPDFPHRPTMTRFDKHKLRTFAPSSNFDPSPEGDARLLRQRSKWERQQNAASLRGWHGIVVVEQNECSTNGGGGSAPPTTVSSCARDTMTEGSETGNLQREFADVGVTSPPLVSAAKAAKTFSLPLPQDITRPLSASPSSSSVDTNAETVGTNDTTAARSRVTTTPASQSQSQQRCLHRQCVSSTSMRNKEESSYSQRRRLEFSCSPQFSAPEKEIADANHVDGKGEEEGENSEYHLQQQHHQEPAGKEKMGALAFLFHREYFRFVGRVCMFFLSPFWNAAALCMWLHSNVFWCINNIEGCCCVLVYPETASATPRTTTRVRAADTEATTEAEKEVPQTTGYTVCAGILTRDKKESGTAQRGKEGTTKKTNVVMVNDGESQEPFSTPSSALATSGGSKRQEPSTSRVSFRVGSNEQELVDEVKTKSSFYAILSCGRGGRKVEK